MRLSRVAMAVIFAVTTLLVLVVASSAADPSAPAHASSLSGSSDADATVVIDANAQQNDNEPDVLLMALLTVGAAGAAAILSLIGYFIRNRVGFWLHRPPPREEGAPDDHH